MADLVFFFGAGASAPFGIPTMQRMVQEFEQALIPSERAKELELYRGICKFLTAVLGRPVDLEAVFTIVDSILNWSPERMGVSALYHALRHVVVQRAGEGAGASPYELRTPSETEMETARSLEGLFERFVQNACRIPEGQTEKIGTVYQDFFQKGWKRLGFTLL